MKKEPFLIIIGILVSIFGLVGLPLIAFLSVISDDSEITEKAFLIPGENEFNIIEPGRYYLWNEHQIIYEGVSYNRSENIPDGVKIRVAKQNGEELKFNPDMRMSFSDGTTSRVSLGYVDIEEPQKILVQITDSPEVRVFSFSQSDIGAFFLGIMGVLFGSVFLFIVGIILFVIGIVKLSKKKREQGTGKEF